MRSNEPSGGMKEIVRSFSNRASRTHWWNLMSSRSTAFCRPVRPCVSNRTCMQQDIECMFAFASIDLIMEACAS